MEGRAQTLGVMTLLAVACNAPSAGTSGDSSEATGGSTVTPGSSTTGGVEETTTTAATSGGPSTGSSSESSTGSSSSSGGDTTELGPNCVQRIYPTRDDKAAPWMLGFDDWEARVAQFGDISGEGVFTVVEQAGQVRMTVLADAGIDCDGLEDHALALEQGFMCSPLDWSDYEMTGYVQLVQPSLDPANYDFTWYGASGRHTGDGWLEGCWGAGYKGSYDYAAGRVRIGKESWHVNYDWREWTDVEGGLVLTRMPDAWLGMKVVRYHFERDGAPGVRNEVWLDLGGTIDDQGCPGNDWQLARVEEDHPGERSWGTEGSECMAPAEDQILFWGGPHATWRWDDTTARLRLMDVREIIAPAQ